MSATAYDQSGRYLAIQTQLGTDRAILTELEGEDTLSKPFVYRIRFATDEAPPASGRCSAARSPSSSACPARSTNRRTGACCTA